MSAGDPPRGRRHQGIGSPAWITATQHIVVQRAAEDLITDGPMTTEQRGALDLLLRTPIDVPTVGFVLFMDLTAEHRDLLATRLRAVSDQVFAEYQQAFPGETPQ